MVVVFINGIPGTGKTTVAHKLAAKLAVEEIIQTDFLKQVFRYLEHDEHAYMASHQAWRLFGKKTRENVLKGFEYCVDFFEPWIVGLANLSRQRLQTVIVEGVQATPKVFQKIVGEKIGFFLVNDEKTHRSRLHSKNRKRTNPHNLFTEHYDVIQIINQHLTKQAKKNGFIIIKNNDSNQTAKKIVEELNGLRLRST